MLMPNVSMNKMAMNESVATTCCFTVATDSSSAYWTILHGGYIGPGWVSAWHLKDGFSKLEGTAWLKMDVDVSGTEDQILALGNPIYGNYAPTSTTTTTSGWHVTKTSGSASIQSAAAAAGLTVTSCSHKNGTCRYYEELIGEVKNYHWDSTSAHTTGGDNWQKGHDAVRYSS